MLLRLARVLDENQIRRIREVELQRSLFLQGPKCLLDPRVASELELRVEQREFIEELVDLLPLRQTTTARLLEEIAKVLDETQQKKWAGMLGEYSPRK